jgi:PmbA protein
MGNMDTSETIEQVLNILRGKSVDGYEIYIDDATQFGVESKDGKVDTFEASHSWGMAVRVLLHQRMGFSFFTSSQPFSSDSQGSASVVERTIEEAQASARVTSPDPCFDFSPGLQNPLPTLPIFDESFEKVSEKEKIEKARRLEEAARSVDPWKIKKVRKASYQEGISHTTLINSNGLHVSYSATLCTIRVAAVAEEAGESEIGWDFDHSHFVADLDIGKVGESAGKRALEKLGGKRVPSGAYPVILRNDVSSEFLSLLAHAFLADQVLKGKSPLKGKLGEKSFSSLLSIVDDGLLPKGISTFPVDGEGVPSRRTLLVSQGKVLGYLFDRYWAHREKRSSNSRAESTGNSRRGGIKSPPTIGISNFYIEPGKLPFSIMLSNLHQGIVIDEVMGLHTVNPISGDFSLGCSGSWVETGKVAYPVKSIAVAGNLFELFRNVREIGEDLRFFGGVGSPSLLVGEMRISGQ